MSVCDSVWLDPNMPAKGVVADDLQGRDGTRASTTAIHRREARLIRRLERRIDESPRRSKR